MREYIAFEFSPDEDVVNDVAAAIDILERNLGHSRQRTEGGPLLVMSRTEGAEQAWELMRRADARLAPPARRNWRWRILYLRALIDAELARGGFAATDTCEQAFAELKRIYYAAQAEEWVRPPSAIKESL